MLFRSEYGGMLAGDMENDLPEWVEDKFGLITRTRDDEAEREAEEEDDGEGVVYEPDQYEEDEKTEWFKAKVKPVHAGLYEVKTKAWPFPHLMTWDGEKWCIRDFDIESTTKPTEWRGLKETAVELDKLKEEFKDLFA